MKHLLGIIAALFFVMANVEAHDVIVGEKYPKAYKPYPYQFNITTGMDLVQRSNNGYTCRWEVTNGKIRDESGNYTLTSLTLNDQNYDNMFNYIYVVWDCPQNQGEIKYYRDNELLLSYWVGISDKCDVLDMFDQTIFGNSGGPAIYGCTNVNLKNVVVASGSDVYIDGFESVHMSPSVSIPYGTSVWIRAGGIAQSSGSCQDIFQMRMAADLNLPESDRSRCVLKQNYPNPFSQTTSIACFVPEMKTDTYIQITDMRGYIVKRVPVTQPGWNEIQVNTSGLNPGEYLYSLIVNNQLIDSKQMSVIR